MIIYHLKSQRGDWEPCPGLRTQGQSFCFPSLFLFLTIVLRPLAKIARGENTSNTNMLPFVRKLQGCRKNWPGSGRMALCCSLPGLVVPQLTAQVGKLRRAYQVWPESEVLEPWVLVPLKHRPRWPEGPGQGMVRNAAACIC